MSKLKYLNVGCGNHFHKDWTNIDFNSYSEHVIAHNLLKGIPIEDESFEVIYHSHVLEHFFKKDAEFFIKECYRVLKKGGIIRICIPDLENLVKTYLDCLNKCNEENKEYANYEWIMLELYDQSIRTFPGGGMFDFFKKDLSNEDFVRSRIGSEVDSIKTACNNSVPQNKQKKYKFKYWKNKIREWLIGEDFKYIELGKFRSQGEIRQWMYDRFSIKNLLESCGFKNIEFKVYNESSIPDWNSFGLDILNNQERRPNSLYVEAQK